MGGVTRKPLAVLWRACVVTCLAASIGSDAGVLGGRSLLSAEPVKKPVKKSAKKTPRSPLEPVAALGEFELHPGFRIELAAAEPEVIDPVALRFDENGRMWVVEMGDYPNGPARGGRPLSRVRCLEDKDGDGRYETSCVFADGLLFATGIQPWDRGVLVTVAGELLYLVDSDGDGVADSRETWYSGFEQQNPQLRANHPTFAMDNRIYVANGLRGGVVATRRSVWAGRSKPVSVSGRDFRFDPRSGVCEAVNGNGQFGLTFDDMGRRFVCSNRNPCRQVVLAGEYMARNPHLAISEVMHDVVTAGAASRIHPISNIWLTSNLHEGQFTAACGVTVYRGGFLGDALSGNVFTCDPTGNLVHREVMSESGASLVGRPGRSEVEFLASRDEWFRPVNMALGPDGALYVVDMYRAVVEHPQWVPDELKDRPDNYSGNDRGRIYRIVPVDHVVGDRNGVSPGLGKLGIGELVEQLRSENGWRRDTAARLIYQRQDKAAVVPLEKLVADVRSAVGRIHAMWALEGLGALTVAVIALALSADDDRVVIHALRLCEPHLEAHPGLLDRIELKRLEAPALRFQWLLSQSHHPDWSSVSRSQGRCRRAVRVCLDRPCDVWTRRALVAGCGRHGLVLLAAVLEGWSERRVIRFDEVLATVGWIAETIGGRGDGEEVTAALELLDPEQVIGVGGRGWAEVQLVGLAGLDAGLRRGNRSLGNPPGRFGRRRLSAMWKQIVKWSLDESDPDRRVGSRGLASGLLRSAAGSVAVPALLGSLRRGNLSALRTLSHFGDEQIGPAVLAAYPDLTAAGRRAALDVLIADPARAMQLMEAMGRGTVSRADLDPGRVDRLRRHGDAGVRKRALVVLASLVPEARRSVLAAYQASLEVDGDPRRGREVFRKNCTACHRVDRLGVEVAPDISDSRRWTRQQLMLSILDPNRAVDSNFFSYSLVTSSGLVHTGLVASETSAAVSIRQPEGKSVRVLRADIKLLKSNGISLMPEGLEKNISVAQMSDLLSFLKNWRYLDGRVPAKVPGRSRK